MELRVGSKTSFTSSLAITLLFKIITSTAVYDGVHRVHWFKHRGSANSSSSTAYFIFQRDDSGQVSIQLLHRYVRLNLITMVVVLTAVTLEIAFDLINFKTGITLQFFTLKIFSPLAKAIHHSCSDFYISFVSLAIWKFIVSPTHNCSQINKNWCAMTYKRKRTSVRNLRSKKQVIYYYLLLNCITAKKCNFEQKITSKAFKQFPLFLKLCSRYTLSNTHF